MSRSKSSRTASPHRDQPHVSSSKKPKSPVSFNTPAFHPSTRSVPSPTAGRFWMMKLIKGGTLDVMLSESPNRTELIAVFEHLCQAVAFAHDHGVIHRDLKPSNVMVGAFDEVQVMDWGLAKVMRNADSGLRISEEARSVAGDKQSNGPDPTATLNLNPQSEASEFCIPNSDDTLPGSVLGTPAYMPPEQASGEIEKIDRRADVFAL